MRHLELFVRELTPGDWGLDTSALPALPGNDHGLRCFVLGPAPQDRAGDSLGNGAHLRSPIPHRKKSQTGVMCPRVASGELQNLGRPELRRAS